MGTNRGCELSDEEFSEVIKNTPLVSIDLIVKNDRGEILLGRRKNDPAKGCWFVPGGRICKNETLSQAFNRIAKNELNLDISINNAKLLGPFDHIYSENKFNKTKFGTHYVALGYEVSIDTKLQFLEDSQHVNFEWFNVENLINDKDVHENTKKYFVLPKSPDTIPNIDTGIYKAFMSHYIHYDRQFWSRIQILLAIQGAVLLGGYNLRDWYLGPAIMMGGVLLTFAVLLLIGRDINNWKRSQEVMDKLRSQLFGPRYASFFELRSTPRNEYLSGQNIIYTVVIIILILNLVLAGLYIANQKHPGFLVPDRDNSAALALEELKKQNAALVTIIEKFSYSANTTSTSNSINKPLKRDAAKNHRVP